MAQYWLKSLAPGQTGESEDDWLRSRSLADFELATGPAMREKQPQMASGDRVLLHAPLQSRVIAEGEILGPPSWQPARPGSERWPWIYPCRIEVWVPLIKEGPQTADVAPKGALNRLEGGGGYAPLSKPEHAAILRELLAAATVRTI
jgi:hypothetical protein